MTVQSNKGFREFGNLATGVSLVMLAFHLYYYCYRAFRAWKIRFAIVDRFVINLHRQGLFGHPETSKLIALGFLLIACLACPPNNSRPGWKGILVLSGLGLALFFLSGPLAAISGDLQTVAEIYIGSSLAGYILLYFAFTAIAGRFSSGRSGDIFNAYNESFPQEERRLINLHSINLPAKYRFRDRTRKSWINLINPFRGILVAGTPGAGKTRYVIRHIIRQQLEKGFALFIYDFKFDDLTRIAYNTLKKIEGKFPVQPGFFVVNFDDLSRSHRCNPLDPSEMGGMTDAAEASRTILLALNREWIRRQGEFFIESAIGFITAGIWFLRKYKDGQYCTLPHLIELIQKDYNELFSVLRSCPEIQTLINPFVSAYLNNAMDQLEGQVASARIALSSLSSPELYYVLSGNEFTLDLNNPKAPKVICMGNNPAKKHIYGAVLSLYISRMIKLVNRPGGLPCHLVFDEFPTIYCRDMDALMATARSHKVATTIGIQDLSQLRKDYGRDQADAIFNLPANLICGQVTGDTARQVSERFGRILQEKETISTNSKESTTSQSQQLGLALPASKIASLSSGEFVGFVADDPGQKIQLKGFHAEILNDHSRIKKEEAQFRELSQVRTLTPDAVEQNYLTIKREVNAIITNQLAEMRNTPVLAKLIISKKPGQNRKRNSP